MKTEAGIRVLKDRSVSLTPRQRAAFILVDGKRSLDEILGAASGMGVSNADMDHLMAQGLIAASTPVPSAAQAPVSSRTPQERYRDAYLVATKLTASLGLRGFRLNLAVEAAGNFEQLAELAPKIRLAVGEEKYSALERALHG